MSDDVFVRNDVLAETLKRIEASHEASVREIRAVIEGNEKYTAEAIAAMNSRIDDLRAEIARQGSSASLRWSIACAVLALAGIIIAFIPYWPALKSLLGV